MRTIDSVKGLDPVVIEVKGLCSFADYFLICSGTSGRHVLALAEHLEEALSQVGVKPLGVEGLQGGLWVLMDYNDVLIHIFSQPLREFYNLEGLWADAPRTSMTFSPATMADANAVQEPVPKQDPSPGPGYE